MIHELWIYSKPLRFHNLNKPVWRRGDVKHIHKKDARNISIVIVIK